MPNPSSSVSSSTVSTADASVAATPVVAPATAEPMTAARQAAALDISRRRRVYPVLLPDGRWRPMLRHADREQALDSLTYSDPVEALEAAEVVLQAAEARQAETELRRLLGAVSIGLYLPWSRFREDGRMEWVVLRAEDEVQVAGPYDGLVAALVEIDRLVAGRGQPLNDKG